MVCGKRCPDGPWRKAVKVVPSTVLLLQSHSTWFPDAEYGRDLFRGTYTLSSLRQSAGNGKGYDYNQLMYRLDLGDERPEG